MVSAPGRIGTGFFVAPRLVLTCAHVVAPPKGEPPERVVGQWGDIGLELEIMPGEFLREEDLALLMVTQELEHPLACFNTQIEPGDELWACGHPAGTYRRGDVVRLVYDGPSVDADGAELLRVTEGRAVEASAAALCSTGVRGEFAEFCVAQMRRPVALQARGLSGRRAFSRPFRVSNRRLCRPQTVYRGFGC